MAKAIEKFSREQLDKMMQEAPAGYSEAFVAAITAYGDTMRKLRDEISGFQGDYRNMFDAGSRGAELMKEAREYVFEGMEAAAEAGAPDVEDARLAFSKQDDFSEDETFARFYHEIDGIRGAYNYATDIMDATAVLGSQLPSDKKNDQIVPYLSGVQANEYAPGDQREACENFVGQYDSNLDASTLLQEVSKEADEYERNLDAFGNCVKDSMEMEAEECPSVGYSPVYEESPVDGYQAAEDVVSEMEGLEEKMASTVAAYNAQHPVRFAFASVGAAIASLREIPAEMKRNKELAESMGMDTRNALEKAATAITARASGMADAAVSKALKTAEKVGNIYKAAVDSTCNAWTKAKSAMAKGIAAAVKSYDIGMEHLSGGNWSKQCSLKSEKRAAMDYDSMDKFDRIAYKMLNATNALHDKLIGIPPEEHWKSVKQAVWGKQENKEFFIGSKKDQRKVEGKLGVVSPQEIYDAKVAYANEKVRGAISSAKESISAFAKTASGKVVELAEKTGSAVKEGAEKSVEFVKSIPGKAKSAANGIAETMKGLAGAAAEKAVEGYTALKIGGLTVAKKAVDKIASMERSMELSSSDEMKIAKRNIVKAKQRIRTAEKTLQDVKENAPEARVFSFSEEKKEEYRAAIALAEKNPTAETDAYLDIMARLAKEGQKKEDFRSGIDKIVYNMKNAGVNLEAKSTILDAKIDVSMALDDYVSRKNAMERHGKAAKKMEKASENLKAKIDALKGGPEGPGGPGGPRDGFGEIAEDITSMMENDKSSDEPEYKPPFSEANMDENLNKDDRE